MNTTLNNVINFLASANHRLSATSTAALCGFLLAATAHGQVQLFSSYNPNGVLNGAPGGITYFNVLGDAWHVTQIETYHFNSGKGTATVGSIHLFNVSVPGGLPLGSFPAKGLNSGIVKNANWVANVSVYLQPGTYAVTDDSPGTWSYNSVSQNKGGGFLYVAGVTFPPSCSYFHPDLRPFGGDGPCGTTPVRIVYNPDPTPKFSDTLNYSAGSPLQLWVKDAQLCTYSYGGTLEVVDDRPTYYAAGNSPASHFAHVQCE